MLSFIRPNALPSFGPFYVAKRNYSPQEGDPFVQENSTHWFVKVFLPDVEESDFEIMVRDSKLILHWTDNKQIQHRGRVYRSRESFEKTVDIPNGITEEDMKVHWEGNIAVVAITKPQKKLELSEKPVDALPEGTLLKMKVPEEGDHSLEVNVKDNHLAIKFETSGKREQGDGDKKSISTFHSKIQRMIPIPEGVDPSDIETQVVNGELIVAMKERPKLIPVQEVEDESTETKKTEPAES